MSLRPFIATYKTMPFGVKMITLWCLCGSVLSLTVFLPGWREQSSGRVVSYAEWWLSGWGFAILAFGAGCMWSAVGLLRKKRLPTILLLAAHTILPMRNATDIINLPILAAVIYFYGFRKKSVRAYFESTTPRNEPA